MLDLFLLRHFIVSKAFDHFNLWFLFSFDHFTPNHSLILLLVVTKHIVEDIREFVFPILLTHMIHAFLKVRRKVLIDNFLEVIH